MPIIDERGRVFGRLNLVDAAIVALVVVLLPAAYGSYLLFRDPVPKLTRVIPPAFGQQSNLQVEVRGENFRPYMRVSFNDIQGRTFLFNNPGSSIVQLADMPPGIYDVVLYDYMQEVSRLPKAFTIEPMPAPPTIVVDISGFMTSLSPDQVKQLQPGHKFPEAGTATGELVSVGTAEPEMTHIKTGDKTTLEIPSGGSLQLPVRIRTSCSVEMGTDGSLRCTVGGVPLAPDANVRYVGLHNSLNVRVSDVHYPGKSRSASVRVRFVVSPEVLGRLKKGDQDLGARAHPAGAMATLVSFSEKDGSASMVRDDRVRQAIPTGRVIIVEAVLSVPLIETTLGWMYKDAPLKVGSALSFETAAYTMDGGVVDVTLDAETPTAAAPKVGAVH